MSIIEKMVDRLPDAYAKKPESVNARLLRIMDESLHDLELDILRVELWGSIDEAKGKTLDYFGEMLGQPRGYVADEVYRFMLRARIARSFVNGNYESVLQALYMAFDARPGEIVLKDDEQNNAAAFLSRLPFRTLNAAGMTAAQALEIIRILLPVGVRLRAESFEGTFRFAKMYGPEDSEHPSGFSDVYKQINPDVPGPPGGYLGLAFGD